MQKRLIHSNFSKNITGFLLEDELYASTDISKHLEEFLKKYLNRLQSKWLDLKTLGRAQNFQMTKRDFRIKVMWEHHMTSPNFGGKFECICQMFVVQIGSKCKRNHFEGIMFWENKSCKFKSTDEELFYKREYSSPIILLKVFFPLEAKIQNHKR